MNLLLAEDDDVSRLFLIEVLTAAGHSVTAVAVGDDAVIAARQQRYDLLLLDLNLPGCAGDRALRSIRSDPQCVNVQTSAIGTTADSSEATRQRLLAAGFASVLLKPMTADVVLAALRGNKPYCAASDRDGVEAKAPWDDAQALQAAGGSARIVAALRELLLRDLPAQSQTILHAARTDRPQEAIVELHKLRAACRFCGASRLGQAADTLEQSLTNIETDFGDALEAFERASAELLIADSGPSESQAVDISD